MSEKNQGIFEIISNYDFEKSPQEIYEDWSNQIDMADPNDPDLIDFYKCFLSKFPYNSQYWTQFAFLNQQFGNGVKIFQEAIKANPRNLDLWKNYVNFMNEYGKDQSEQIYKSALDKIGHLIGSNFLWMEYLEVIGKKNLLKLNQLFLKISTIPIKESNLFIQKFIYQMIQDTNNFQKRYLNQIFFICINKFQEKLMKLISQAINLFNFIELKLAMINQIQKNIQQNQKNTQRIINYEDQIYSNFDRDTSDLWIDYIQFIADINEDPKIIIQMYETAVSSNSLGLKLWDNYVQYLKTKTENIHSFLMSHGKYLLFLKHELFFEVLNELPLQSQLVHLESISNQGSHFDQIQENIQIQIKIIDQYNKLSQCDRSTNLYNSLMNLYNDNTHDIHYFLLLSYQQFIQKFTDQQQNFQKYIEDKFIVQKCLNFKMLTLILESKDITNEQCLKLFMQNVYKNLMQQDQNAYLDFMKKYLKMKQVQNIDHIIQQVLQAFPDNIHLINQKEEKNCLQVSSEQSQIQNQSLEVRYDEPLVKKIKLNQNE